ncbi:MAG TPA: hypothetical protein VFB72_01815 [Verrucomicrobiae bacterium]|nr:hypothetical protein [Verrucomicrobiae bacterium]
MPTLARFDVSKSIFGNRSGNVLVVLECCSCPKQIELPEPKMVVAAAFLFPLSSALLFFVLKMKAIPDLLQLRSGMWLCPIYVLVMVAWCSWLASIVYRGIINRLLYAPQIIAAKPREKPANYLSDYAVPGTGAQPLPSAAAASRFGNDGVQAVRSIREKIQAKKHRRNSMLAASAFLLAAVCCVGYQIVENREHRTLLEAGHRTQGTLDNITRTTHDLILSSYTFEISYLDDAGASHRQTMDANAQLFNENTYDGDKFTHHQIEVVFLPYRPDVAGLPKALGISVRGYVVALLLSLLGFLWFRSLSRKAARTNSNQ